MKVINGTNVLLDNAAKMTQGFVTWLSNSISGTSPTNLLIVRPQKMQGDSNFAFQETQGDGLCPKVKLLSNFACKAHPDRPILTLLGVDSALVKSYLGHQF